MGLPGTIGTCHWCGHAMSQHGAAGCQEWVGNGCTSACSCTLTYS